MKVSGIYKIESKLKPERVYIGSAVNISNRWWRHLRHLKLNRHRNIKLQRHYDKYGESDLRFSILLGCNKEDLIKTEQYFIDSYKPYFNIQLIANSNLGRKWSEETKCKMRIAQQKRRRDNPILIKRKIKKRKRIKETPSYVFPLKERLRSEETKQKMRDAWITRRLIPMSEETREKIRNATKGENNPMYGKHHSEESKERNRISNLEYRESKMKLIS
jgi:group I intron endonuclease